VKFATAERAKLRAQKADFTLKLESKSQSDLAVYGRGQLCEQQRSKPPDPSRFPNTVLSIPGVADGNSRQAQGIEKRLFNPAQTTG